MRNFSNAVKRTPPPYISSAINRGIGEKLEKS
jgi:hypothetical protein